MVAVACGKIKAVERRGGIFACSAHQTCSGVENGLQSIKHADVQGHALLAYSAATCSQTVTGSAMSLVTTVTVAYCRSAHRALDASEF